MTSTPLSQISEMEDGLPIPMLSGRIKIVFEYKKGEGEYGPWSFQSAVLTNGESEANLKFKNMDDMTPLQGKEVTIRANKSTKHGLTGVVKAVETYQGKTYHKVLLTQSCKIVVGLNGNEDEGHLETASPMMMGRSGDPVDFIPMTHGAKGEPLSGVDEARKHLVQSVNLYNLCVDIVDTAVKPRVNGMTADMYQAAVGTLFIEGSRAGLVNKMPVHPLSRRATQENAYRAILGR